MRAHDRYPLIDSLRAIAAFAVVGTHTAFFAGAYQDGSALRPYAMRLEVGVAIFFVISGFLLYRPFLVARLDGARRPATAAYAWRRFLRIVPAYWVALTVTALALDKGYVFEGWRNLVTFYGLGQSYREATIPQGLTQAWTLTIEVAFYVFLPLFALLMSRLPARSAGAILRTEALALLALALASWAWKALVLHAQHSPDQVVVTPLLLALPAYLDQFALGMGLALLTVALPLRERAPAIVRAIDARPWVPWLMSAVAFWVVSTQIGIGGRLFEPMSVGQWLERHALYAVVATGLVLPAVVGTPERGWVRRLLGTRLLAWLGLISYGVYLWHNTVLALLARWGYGDVGALHPYLRWGLAAVAGATVCGAVSWYLVERPALSLRRLVPGRPREHRPIDPDVLGAVALESAHPRGEEAAAAKAPERDAPALSPRPAPARRGG